jgi:DNA end-binding protein Ku
VIVLDEFVGAGEIDPMYYDPSYYLGAGKDGQDAYRLLHDALERSEQVGIGRWVFHNREYLAAVRPLERVLALHTMRFQAELIDADALDIPAPSRKPNRRELEMAGKLVDSLHARFDPSSDDTGASGEVKATRSRGGCVATGTGWGFSHKFVPTKLCKFTLHTEPILV